MLLIVRCVIITPARLTVNYYVPVRRNKMDILDWFDVYNFTHIRAYVELQSSGIWPKNFIPEDVTFSNGWHIGLLSKFTDAYLESHHFYIKGR